jgi:hypothetical protein
VAIILLGLIGQLAWNVEANRSRDVSDKFVAYTLVASFIHRTSSFLQYEGANISPFIVDTTLWGLESFPCQESDILIYGDLMRYLRWAWME